MPRIKIQDDCGRTETVPLASAPLAAPNKSHRIQIGGVDWYAPLGSVSDDYATKFRFQTADGTTYAYLSQLPGSARKLTQSLYRMSDLYPGTYRTMTVVPETYDISDLEDISGMFAGCEALVAAPELDTSHIKRMSSLFEGCTCLKTIPGVIDFSSVEVIPYQIETCLIPQCEYMFEGCTSLKAITTRGIYRTVETIYRSSGTQPQERTLAFFASTGSRTITDLLEEEPGEDEPVVAPDPEPEPEHEPAYEPKDLYLTNKNYKMSVLYPETYRTMKRVPDNLRLSSDLTSLTRMFEGCEALEEAPNLNTSQVTAMSSMFSGCKSLKTVPCLDMSRVSNTTRMFEGCESLDYILWTIDLSKITYYVLTENGKSKGKVPTCYNMFAGCHTKFYANGHTAKISTNYPKGEGSTKSLPISDFFGSNDIAWKTGEIGKTYDSF